mmetsp:Transcript_13133/g.39400  ORF Transcript_13133/g.39400 Transcript_13133/m.39400 type:complete len:141 (+) Transcript_13133:768-1190(+)
MMSLMALRSIFQARGRECDLGAGSFAMYRLPFKMLVSKFRLAYGCCDWQRFAHWHFQGFAVDAEQEWTTLYDATTSPWAVDASHSQDEGDEEEMVENCHTLPADAIDADFASDRFRIILRDQETCMHIRAFELFGTMCAG